MTNRTWNPKKHKEQRRRSRRGYQKIKATHRVHFVQNKKGNNPERIILPVI